MVFCCGGKTYLNHLGLLSLWILTLAFKGKQYSGSRITHSPQVKGMMALNILGLLEIANHDTDLSGLQLRLAFCNKPNTLGVSFLYLSTQLQITECCMVDNDQRSRFDSRRYHIF
jgi:hypothetical protein